jgi:hypothetical protein
LDYTILQLRPGKEIEKGKTERKNEGGTNWVCSPPGSVSIILVFVASVIFVVLGVLLIHVLGKAERF